MPADCLVAIMEKLKDQFTFSRGTEVAIEIDPTSLPPDRRDALGQMSVTRISLGVQDLEPAVQKAIGRERSYEETQACAEEARALGVGSLNLDLIYGLRCRRRGSHADCAPRARPESRPRCGFRLRPCPVDEASSVANFRGYVARTQGSGLRTQRNPSRLTREGGYVAVGLDHYALPNNSMAKAATAGRLKRSFQGYTTDAAHALIGFGASSIGSLPQGYVQNAPTAVAYAKEIETDQLATVRGIALTPDDRLRRDIIERVMCDLEVDLDGLAGKHGADPGS